MRFLCVFFLCFIGVAGAQVKGVNVFNVARYGTVTQIDSIYKKMPAAIDSVSSKGFSPLILACYRGNDKVAVYIAEKSKNINYKSDNGTALMAAVFRGNYELAKTLLQHGANANLADANGITPLIYAIQFKNEAVVKLLLENGADKTQKDNVGKSPFEYAVFSQNQNIINLLKD